MIGMMTTRKVAYIMNVIGDERDPIKDVACKPTHADSLLCLPVNNCRGSCRRLPRLMLVRLVGSFLIFMK
jgi:hypothetical protein